MGRLIERVDGLDVQKQTVAACVRVPGSKGTREQYVRTFGTTAAELLALRDGSASPGACARRSPTCPVKKEELFRAGKRRLASDLGARGLHQASKRRRIGRGQVRQDLSVEIDPGLLETAHEG
jgi:hypothetical protein